MGSRGQSGRDKTAGDIVGQYELAGIGENKGKILNFFRYMDNTDEGDIEDRFQEEAEKLADDLSESMVYRDDDARDEYNRIRRHLNGTYTLSGRDKSSIPDFTKYARSSENFLKIGRSGTPVDTAYEELSDMWPSRFPRSISNPADQLQRINSVLSSLRDRRIVSASAEDREAAAPYIYDDLARAYNEIRRKRGKRVLNFGSYTGSGRGGSSSRSKYAYSDDDELPFF